MMRHIAPERADPKRYQVEARTTFSPDQRYPERATIILDIRPAKTGSPAAPELTVKSFKATIDLRNRTPKKESEPWPSNFLEEMTKHLNNQLANCPTLKFAGEEGELEVKTRKYHVNVFSQNDLSVQGQRGWLRLDGGRLPDEPHTATLRVADRAIKITVQQEQQFDEGTVVPFTTD